MLIYIQLPKSKPRNLHFTCNLHPSKGWSINCPVLSKRNQNADQLSFMCWRLLSLCFVSVKTFGTNIHAGIRWSKSFLLFSNNRAKKTFIIMTVIIARLSCLRSWRFDIASILIWTLLHMLRGVMFFHRVVDDGRRLGTVARSCNNILYPVISCDRIITEFTSSFTQAVA